MSWRHAIMRFCVAGLVASGLALAIAATCAAQGADDLGDAPGSSSGALSRGGTSSAGHQSVEEEFGLDPNPSKGWPGRVRLSLEDCLRLALTRNMRLRAAGEDIEAARSQRQEASAAFWPIIEYKYRMAPVPTDVDNAFNAFFDGQLTFFNSIHVGIGMPVTTFGQLLLAKRLADGGIEAAKIRRAQTESEVVYQVKQLFYGIQLAHETIGLLEDALKKIDKRIGAE
ncbi:MAG: TolC family protein, partial [Proteobacteria bacterium]|nr:TolC family protein [Pseudomonadota bacterium]